MIKAALINNTNKETLEIVKIIDNWNLVVTRTAEVKGKFNSVTHTVAGTSIVTEPRPNGSLVLTDLVVSSDRVNGATITIQFTDGINTIVIFSADVTDAPCNISHPVEGRWKGWKNARLEVVTVGNVAATVTLGYYKVSEDIAETYEKWSSER